MMSWLTTLIFSIQGAFLIFCLVALCYLAVRRLNIRDKEDFEKRDN